MFIKKNQFDDPLRIVNVTYLSKKIKFAIKNKQTE